MKMRHRAFLMSLFLFVFCFIPLSVSGQLESTAEFSAEKAYGHIQYLSQKIGPRPAGSKNEEKAAEYLHYMLAQYGWKVRVQPFSKIVSQANPLQPENRIQIINSQNVIAELPGKEPETIVLGAHYDTADLSTPGALDNASGVGVLLELARVLGQSKHDETYQIVFFGAEEYGLVGSSYYAAQSDLSAVQWMVNLDMVGTPLEIDIAGKKSASPELVRQIVKTVSAQKIPFHVSRDFVVMTRDGAQGGNSDFSPFLDQGIPAVGFGIAGRPGGFYHRPEDRIEQVSLQDLEKVGTLLPELLRSVHLAETGSRTWDEWYLPFQLSSQVIILPTLSLSLLFIAVLFFTGFILFKALRREGSLRREPFLCYLSFGIALPIASVLVVTLSGAGEFLWQFLKGKNTLWYSYPGIFLALRILLALCLMMLVSFVLYKIPRPKSLNFYWVVSVGLLLLGTLTFGFYRIDLALPFLFWLFCLDLLYFFPHFILVGIGPYFIFKTHWELLNSQQGVSFYETIHQYPLVFTILYALLLIPAFLAGLFVAGRMRSSWRQIVFRLRTPMVIGIILILFGTGLVPNYTKTYPQTVTVRKEWSENKNASVRITSKDNLPKTLLKEFKQSSGRIIEVSVPAEKPPMDMQISISQTGEGSQAGARLMNLNLAMNYAREPYLVRVKFESGKPFRFKQMDDFLPVSKLPRKLKLEGKERNGKYTLVLERTPPHKSQIHWVIEAEGTVQASFEILFAGGSPALQINDPILSLSYEEIYRSSFEF